LLFVKNQLTFDVKQPATLSADKLLHGPDDKQQQMRQPITTWISADKVLSPERNWVIKTCRAIFIARQKLANFCCHMND